MTLEVIDLSSNTVCENVADNRTSCTWTPTPGGVYMVRVNNLTGPLPQNYRLCAS